MDEAHPEIDVVLAGRRARWSATDLVREVASTTGQPAGSVMPLDRSAYLAGKQRYFCGGVGSPAGDRFFKLAVDQAGG